MNNVDCNGTETSLDQCWFRGWDITECNHTEDAVVICQTSKFSLLSRTMRNPTMWSPNWPDTNVSVQAQKMARSWKFWF